jgi:calcineurin-like phosphoesterase family protein
MVDIWFLSDTHFGHTKTVTEFKRHDGSPLRDFKHVDEMDEHLIERWNSVVKPQDHVYHLGDVVINRKKMPLLERCNGHKRLVRGNHDIFKTEDYLAYFDEIYACRVFDGVRAIFTHIPIHPESLGRFKVNVHGHLHHQPKQVGKGYFSVCVEMLDNYTPIHLDQIKAMIDANEV